MAKSQLGIGGRPSLDVPKKKPLEIPMIKWKCPPRIHLNDAWLVAAGEESEEVKVQKLREAKMLDVAHPYDACPSDPLDVPADHLSDSEVPLVPLIPIEEQVKAVAESDPVVPEDPSLSSLPQVITPGKPIYGPSDPSQPSPSNVLAIDADVIAASAAVMTALMECKEQGSLIDPNLLVKLLSDPEMIKKLMDGQQDLASMSTVPVNGSWPNKSPITVDVNNAAGEHCTSESASKLIQVDFKAEQMGKDVSNSHGLMREPKPVGLSRAGTDPRIENPAPKLQVTAGSGATTQLSGTHAVTSLPSVPIPIPIPKPNPVSENFTFGQGVSDHGGRGSVSVGKLASLPSPKSDLLKKGAQSDLLKTGSSQVSGPFPVTSTAPLPIPSGFVSVGKSLPSPKSDLLKLGGQSDLLKTGDSQVPGPYPVTSPAPLSAPRSNPMVAKFTQRHGVPGGQSDLLKTGASQISGPYPVTPPAPLPAPRSNPMVANFTQGHGVPDHRRSGSASVRHSQASLPSFPNPISRYPGTENSCKSSANPNPAAVGLNRFPSPHQNRAAVGLNRFPSPHQNPAAVGGLNRFPSPHRNLGPVSLNRSPSPYLGGDTGFQLEPFSPSSKMPDLISSSGGSSGSSFLQLPNVMGSKAPPVKDKNYFKELIRKHGEIQPDVPKTGNLQMSSLDLQLLSTLQRSQQQPQKMQTPCKYFNGPTGCRNGPKCSFRHDVAGQVGVPDAKRMKLSG